MAEYGVDYLSDENKYTLNARAHFLYGAGRLGKDLRDSTGYLNLALRPAGGYTEVQSCSSCATATLNSNPLYRYGSSVVHTRQLGYKQFELSNHTGNILSVVTDRKNAVDIGIWVPSTRSFNTGSTDNRLDYYVADVVEVTDYYPGGMPMPGRSVPDMQFRSFKWGHNGQFNDDEIYGKGNTRMAEFREYDARLMRRWNTDPMAHAGQSLYEAFYSNPIEFADPLGLKPEGDFGPGKRGAHRRARATAREHKRNGETNVQVIHNKEKKRYEVTYDRRPQEDPTVESEAGQRRVDVLVIGTDPGTFPYETDNAWTNAVHKIKWGATFLAGMANSIGSNGLWGAGRADPNMFEDNYAQAAAEGQIAGDYISFAIALGEMYIGATLEGGGIVLDATVIGLPGGVTLNIAGAALMTHSAGMGAHALRNIVDNMNIPEGGKSHSGSSKGGSPSSGNQKFGGENDTQSKTSRESLRKAKDQSGIPRVSSLNVNATYRKNTLESR